VKLSDRTLLVFRIVQAATLAALLWKVHFFIDAAWLYYHMPLQQRFFPEVLQSPLTFASGYLLAMVGLAWMLITRGSRLRRGLSWLTLIALAVLCLHQGSYNDATFTTAWWVTLWSTWFAGRIGREGESLLRRSSWLSQGIIAMILLGGAVGKWTAEYWSGEVFYEIYFIDRDFWLFNWLRSSCEPTKLRDIATWYSRGVIITESVCGATLWILPRRVAAAVALTVLAGIAICSSFYLFSVVLSLMGLAFTGLLVPDKPIGAAGSTPALDSPAR